MFPEPREQAKAIGAYTFVAVAGGSIGLLLGGVLTETINWHWIFFVNIPIGVATALAAIRLVPDREGIGLTAGADLPGAVLLTGGLMLFVYTILGVAEEGWGRARRSFGSDLDRLADRFVARQARVANPLMPLRLFRSRQVSGANLVQALMVVGMFGMFFLGALYMQRILGYDALQVGLAYLPLTIVMGTMSFRFTGQLNLKYGPEATLVPVIFIVAGLLWLARTPIDANYVFDLLPSMILIGLGAGLGFPSLMTLAMSGTTESDSGLASGSSTRASRWVARSAWRYSPRLRPSAPRDCSPTASRQRRRSTLAITSPTSSAPGWCSSRSPSRSPPCGRGFQLARAGARTCRRTVPAGVGEPALRSWPRRPSGRRSRPARCPPPWPTRARRPAWGSRSAAAGAPARRRRLRRRHDQRLRADSGRGPRPRRSDALPRLTPEQVEYLADRHPVVIRTRGARLRARPARDPLYVVLSGALDIIDQAPEGDRYFTQCRRGPSPPISPCSPASRRSPRVSRPNRHRFWRSRRRTCAGSLRPRPSSATSCGRWSRAGSGSRVAAWVSSG